MENYKQLRDRQQKEVNDFPFFFAFNNEQFADGMRMIGLHPEDTDKIYKLGDTGGFYAKTESARLKEMWSRHEKELSDAMQDDDFAISAFIYELANHEFCITYDFEDALSALGMEYGDLDERLKTLLYKAKDKYLEECDNA